MDVDLEGVDHHGTRWRLFGIAFIGAHHEPAAVQPHAFPRARILVAHQVQGSHSTILATIIIAVRVPTTSSRKAMTKVGVALYEISLCSRPLA